MLLEFLCDKLCCFFILCKGKNGWPGTGNAEAYCAKAHSHFPHFIKIGDEHRADRLNQNILHTASHQINIIHKETANQPGNITPLGYSIFHVYFVADNLPRLAGRYVYVRENNGAV